MSYLFDIYLLGMDVFDPIYLEWIELVLGMLLHKMIGGSLLYIYFR